jgi:hypothetical protein
MSSTNKNCNNNKTVTTVLKVDCVLSTKIFSSASTLEVDTLSKIIDLSKQCNKFLDKLQASRRQVLLDIKNNENDFFDKNPHLVSQFNALFDPTIFQSKVDMFLNELQDTVDTYCCHEYIEDLIDVEYDQSRRVVYCQLCELTKK